MALWTGCEIAFGCFQGSLPAPDGVTSRGSGFVKPDYMLVRRFTQCYERGATPGDARNLNCGLGG